MKTRMDDKGHPLIDTGRTLRKIKAEIQRGEREREDKIICRQRKMLGSLRFIVTPGRSRISRLLKTIDRSAVRAEPEN